MVKIPVLKLPEAVLWHRDVDEVANRLGYFFITWSLLEETIRSLYADVVLRGSGGAARASRVSSHVGRRSQVETVKLILANEANDAEWHDELISALSQVSDLAASRNRFAHQLWTESDAGVIVRSERGERQFHRKPKQICPAVATPVLISEMEEVLNQVYELHRTLESLRFRMIDWIYEGQP